MINEEKILKRFLKKRMKITLGIVVAFLITGNLAEASIGLFNKEYTVGSGENKTISQENWIIDSTLESWGDKTQYALTAHHGGLFNIDSSIVNVNHVVDGEIAKGKAISAVEAVGGGKIYLKNTDMDINVSTDTGVATGIEAYDFDEKDKGSLVEITGGTLTIKSYSENLNAFGIKTGSKEYDASHSQINIDADKTLINVSSTQGISYGLAAYNGGSIKVNSNDLEINASRAIDIRGNSYVGINESNSSENKVVLNGNIQFTNTPTNSEIASEVDEGKGLVLNLSNNESKLNGNIIAGTSSENKDIIRLGVSNGASWNMTGGSSLPGTVTLQGGTINFGEKGGLSITGNGLIMNGTGEGYNSTITGTGNINSNVAISNEGNIFNLGEGSTLTGKVTLNENANAQNQGYLALGKDSSISVGQGATFTNEEGATLKGTVNNQKVIEVNGGTAINNGTIDLTGTTGSYAMYASGNDSTLTNGGTIVLTYNGDTTSKAFGQEEGLTGVTINTSANNKGTIKLENIDAEDFELSRKEIEELVLGQGVENTGLIVDKDGNALYVSANNMIKDLGDNFSDILSNMNKNKKELNVDSTGATIKAGSDLKDNSVDSINIVDGNLNLESTETSNKLEISDVTINVSKTEGSTLGGLSIGKDLELVLSNGVLQTEVKTEESLVKFNENSILNLNSMTVKGNLGEGAGEITTAGKTDIVGNINVDSLTTKDNTSIEGDITANTLIVSSGRTNFDGKLVIGSMEGNRNTSSGLTINKGAEGYFSADSLFADNSSINGDGTSIFEVVSEDQNAINNSNGLTINTDFGFDTSKVTDEGVEIILGGTFNGDYINNVEGAYGQSFDKDAGKLTISFNKDLLAEYGANYNNIYQSLRLVRDKYNGALDTKEENLAAVDKIYTGTIYADTVRMAYDNNKLVENELLKINPEVAIGKWVANGKALYMRNEYNREGIVKNYRTEKESAGLLAAAEYGLNSTTNLGLAFAGINNDIDTDTGKSEGQAFYLGAFAKKELGNYRLTAGLGYEFNRFDADEKIFGGSEKYNSNVYSAYVEGRYSKDLGDSITFEPKLKLGYTYVDQDAIQDGTYKLASQDISIFDTEVGADFIKTVPLKDGRLDVVFGASYAMAFGDTDDDFEGRFYNSKEIGTKFNMMGANVAERNINLGLGLGVTKDSGLFYNGGVTFKAGSDNYRDYGVTLGAGYKF